MKLRSVTALLVTAAMLTGVGLFAGCNGANDHFIDKLDQGPTSNGVKTGAMRVALKGGSQRMYGLFVPYNYNPATKYPVIIFLHGIGEGGSDARSNLRVGLGPFVADQAERFGFIVIFPQSGSGSWSANSAEASDVITALDEVASKYSVDKDRVSLTGLSTGGYGTYAIGAQFHDRFAAIVPMGSNGMDTSFAPALTHVAVRAYCSESGDIFAGWNDKNMVEAIKTAGGHAEFIPTPTSGHDCWEYVYGQSDLLVWLKNQRRQGSTGSISTPATPVVAMEPAHAPANAILPAAATPAPVRTTPVAAPSSINPLY